MEFQNRGKNVVTRGKESDRSTENPKRVSKPALDVVHLLEDDPNCGVDCTLRLGLPQDAKTEPSNVNQRPQINIANLSPTPQVRGNPGLMDGGVGLYNVGENMASVQVYRSQITNLTSTRFGFYHNSPLAVLGGSSRVIPRMHDEVVDCVMRCASCGTTITPLWRKGPEGLKSLCNACGIRFKKEERRALGIKETNGRSKEDSVKGHKSGKKTKF